MWIVRCWPTTATHALKRLVALTNEQKALDTADIYDIMREYCTALYAAGADKPVSNYKVDFVELSKTAEYKSLAILEQLDLYDIVSVIVGDLGINIKVQVISYKYDCLKDRYKSIELGQQALSVKYSQAEITKNLQESIVKTESAVEYATT